MIGIIIGCDKILPASQRLLTTVSTTALALFEQIRSSWRREVKQNHQKKAKTNFGPDLDLSTNFRGQKCVLRDRAQHFHSLSMLENPHPTAYWYRCESLQPDQVCCDFCLHNATSQDACRNGKAVGKRRSPTIHGACRHIHLHTGSNAPYYANRKLF